MKRPKSKSNMEKKQKGMSGTRTLKFRVPKIKGIKFSKKGLLILAAVLILAAGGGFAAKMFFFDKAPEKNHAKANTEDSGENEEKAEEPDISFPEGHLASDFIRTLNSEQYLIRYRTTTVYEGSAYEVETNYAVSGNMIAMASTDRATIVRDGKVYMVNHLEQSMISWKITETEHLKRIDTEGLAYLGTHNEEGLVCEEYTTPKTGLKLYFSGNDLVKMATVINDQNVVMDIIEISEEVPENLFEIPSAYRNTEI